MRLLICTQVVDRSDPVLGFFHRSLEKLAEHFESVTVLCLRTGEYDLPRNIHVQKLPSGRLRRALFLLRGALKLRRSYDAVFVHMNEEYVLLAGPLWRLLGKRVYLWRNHYQGSLRTDLAAFFCTKVFCTSKFSYTAKYKKTVLMPVGIDLELFRPMPGVVRTPRSVLFLGRLAPSKRPELLLEALGSIEDGRATFCGPGDERYIQSLKERAQKLGVSERVRFIPAVRNAETPRLYGGHEVFVNCSPSGMLDKTVYEAAACRCLVLASSKDWAQQAGNKFAFTEGNALELAQKLRELLKLSDEEKQRLREGLAQHAQRHSLAALVERLVAEMKL